MHDLSDLEYIYHAVREKSMTRAAAAMGRTQSAMTQRIAKYERTTGITLFIRHPGALTMEPTAACLSLFHGSVEPFMAKYSDFLRENQNRGGTQLEMAGSEFMVEHYMMPLLPTVWQRLPHLGLNLQSPRLHQTLRGLLEGQIHLGIVVLDERPAGLQWEPLLKLPVVLLVPPHSPLQSLDALMRTDPRTLRMVCPPAGEGVVRRFEAFRTARQLYWPFGVVPSTAMVPWRVAQGGCVGLCIGAKPLLQDKNVRVLQIPELRPLTVAAVWRGKPKPELRAVIEIVASAARELIQSNPPFLVPEKKPRRDRTFAAV